MHSTGVGLVDHALEGHECLKCECTYRCDVRVLAADRQQDLPNGHTGGSPQRLAECATHARLQAMHSEVTLDDRSNLHKAAPY